MNRDETAVGQWGIRQRHSVYRHVR